MSSAVAVEVSALAINVTIPGELRWTDVRRGEEFELSTLNVRLLRDGLATKAYGRPTPRPCTSVGPGPAGAGGAVPRPPAVPNSGRRTAACESPGTGCQGR